MVLTISEKKLFKILQNPHRCYVTTPKEHLIYATVFTPVEVLSIECTAETLIRLCSFELEDQGICQKMEGERINAYRND